MVRNVMCQLLIIEALIISAKRNKDFEVSKSQILWMVVTHWIDEKETSTWVHDSIFICLYISTWRILLSLHLHGRNFFLFSHVRTMGHFCYGS